MGRTCGRRRKSRCLIVLISAVVCFLLSADVTAQISKLPHDGTPGDFFGAAVAIDDSLAIVGAPSEDACGQNSGAAYIFRRNSTSGVWKKLARVSSPQCEPGQLFGRSVAISGQTAVIAAGGESFAGDRSASAYIVQILDESVDIVERLQPGTGEVEGLFASQVSIDGNRILVISSGDRARGRFQGMAHIYQRDPEGVWKKRWSIQPARIVESTAFGGRGAIRGGYVMITAPGVPPNGRGAVYVFEHNPMADAWLQRSRIDGFSHGDLTVSISDSHALVGDHSGNRGQGRALLLRREVGGAWISMQELRPSVTTQSGALGTSVALNGDRALVVGYDEQLDVAHNIDRVVFVFEPDPQARWSQRHVVDIGEVYFGASVDFDGRDAIVGLAGDDVSGAAYVVRIH
jgi:hypothetical protein